MNTNETHEPRRVLGVEKVGDFTIEIVTGEPSPEAQRRWDGRVDKLVAWLRAQWDAEQKQKRETKERSGQCDDAQAPTGPRPRRTGSDQTGVVPE